MSTDVMTSTTSIAPITTSPDGMKYEQAIAFLDEQERRAVALADRVESLHQMRIQIWMDANMMMADHQTATDALARFGVSAPGMNDTIGLLNVVANPVGPDLMVEAFMAMDAVASGCAYDRADLQARFGTLWEMVKAEAVDANFLND